MSGFKVFVVLALFATVVNAGFQSYGGLEEQSYGSLDGQDSYDIYGDDNHAPAQYSFEYGVNDPFTGDEKRQQETREGDRVTGYYSVKEADGTTRHVHYTADDYTGFKATVTKSGQPTYP